MREMDFIFAYHRRLLMSDSLRGMDIIRIELGKFRSDIDRAVHKEETKEEDRVALVEALGLIEDLIKLADEFFEKMTRLRGLE